MADQRKPGGIAWTDESWNPVRGCSRVSEGCRNCYAEVRAARFSGPGLPYEGLATHVAGEARWTGAVRLVPERLEDPLRWRRPRRVFVNSMSDLFHEGLSDSDVDQVCAVMAQAAHHTFQVLTKRAHRALLYVGGGARDRVASLLPAHLAIPMRLGGLRLHEEVSPTPLWPLRNLWLGVSVEDQRTADERIPLLLQTPAAVRWVSYEPALGPVDFAPWLVADCCDCLGTGEAEGAPCEACGGDGHRTRLDWIVVGGESGTRTRPLDLAWVWQTVQQCRQAGVPVFVKQLGARPLGLEHGDRIPGTDLPWRLLDRSGGDPSEWPEGLRVRALPAPTVGRSR